MMKFWVVIGMQKFQNLKICKLRIKSTNEGQKGLFGLIRIDTHKANAVRIIIRMCFIARLLPIISTLLN